MLRILGIDPGSRVTGYGIIESNGHQSQHIASGCIRLAGDNFPDRLGEIFQQVSEIIQQHQPDVMAIEDIFVSKNASSALKLGQARGAAICAGITNGLAVSEYTPRTVKQSVVGNGGADKSQVEQMVRVILKLETVLAADQADALAIALSHAHIGSTRQRLATGGWRR